MIHAGIGKVSFDDDKLAENVRAFVDAVAGPSPPGAKGTYLKKVSLSSTMGPGVSVDLSSATGALIDAGGAVTRAPLRNSRSRKATGMAGPRNRPVLSETAGGAQTP